jgi:urea transport system substrate-binding protein
VQGRTKQILIIIVVVAAYAGIASAMYAEIISAEIIDQKQDSELINIHSIDSNIQLDEDNPIKVGILHSMSGSMASTEAPVVDSYLMAIDEINARGGVLGRMIVPIVADGETDWDVFASEAERLIVEEKVSAIFGAYTSASRKAMLPIFEKYNHLLFYPPVYEGMEQSPNIIYLGATPNQRFIPATDWVVENLGTRIFLVGTEYVYPVSVNEVIRQRVNELGAEIVGEEYRLLGDQDFSEIVEKIVEANPDVIISVVVGESTTPFYKELRRQGIYPNIIPTIMVNDSSLFDISREMSPSQNLHMEGDYAALNYFWFLDLPENKEFVQNYKNKYGSERFVSDPIQSAYNGIYLFEKAVQKAGSDDVNEIRQAVRGLTVVGAEGIIGIDPETQHSYKYFRIGKFLENNEFEIIHSSEEPIKPIPYPKYKSEEEWEVYLKGLYDGWDQSWSNLGEN